MRLFKIITSDYKFGENVKHRAFLTDKEELEFRRLMDDSIQKQTIKNYEMKELHINDIDDIRNLIGLSLSDLKKLILHKDEYIKEVKQDKDNNNQDISSDEIDIIDKLQKLTKDNNTVTNYNGYINFHTLNELIIKYYTNKLYLNKRTITNIINNSTDIKNIDISTFLTFCQSSKTVPNMDMMELWYSINCGFNFNNSCYYTYGLKTRFTIDDRLEDNAIVGLNNDNNITLLYNIPNKYLDNTLKDRKEGA